MPTFSRNSYPSSQHLNTIGERYRRQLRNRPFTLFGLPFVFTMVAGSFFLTPATAVRYEKHDRKTHMLDTQTALGLRGHGEGERDLTQEERIAGGTRRGAGSGAGAGVGSSTGGGLRGVRAASGRGELRGDIREEYWRLAGMGDKLDDYEPKRVKRLPGEPDGTFD